MKASEYSLQPSLSVILTCELFCDFFLCNGGNNDQDEESNDEDDRESRKDDRKHGKPVKREKQGDQEYCAIL